MIWWGSKKVENGQKISELSFPLTALLLKEGQLIKRKQVEKWHFFIGTNLSICCYANIDCHPYVCNRKNCKSLNHSFARNAFFFAFVIVSALKCSEDAKIKKMWVSEWKGSEWQGHQLSCPVLDLLEKVWCRCLAWQFLKDLGHELKIK